MKIQILGAHNIESQATRLCCLVIDDILALDAGALTSSLSFTAQQNIRAVLLTHYHYDHVRDVPALAMAALLYEVTTNVYSTQAVYDALAQYLFNGDFYPRFLGRPPQNPAIKFKVVEPGRGESIDGYMVLPVAVSHSIPAVGYQITSSDDRKVFYTGDTGPGLSECWRQISPELLIIEVTSPNQYEEFARRAKHLTPSLLESELRSFREIRGYLPRVVVVHMNPRQEKEIEAEIATVAKSLGSPITLGNEGMLIHL